MAIILLGAPRAEAVAARKIDLACVPFTSVIDFESPKNDRVFLGGNVKFEKSAAFTGKYGVSIPAGQSIRLRVGAALVGREFPGRWKYLGFHTKSSAPSHLRVRWRDGELVREAIQVDIDSTTREWLELFTPTDLEKLELELINESTEATTVGIDDFILCDPELVIQKSELESIGLERTQLGWYVETGDKRVYAGRWDPMSDAVNPLEWSPMRIVFADARGRRFSFDARGVRHPTIEPQPLLEIQILDDSARIDRNSPGDSNQDGYDESIGSYRIFALTPTVTLRVSPQDKPVDRTLIEVSKLPPGEVRVTVEGELVDRIHRFKDGRVLVELPITVDRPMQIEIRSIEIK